MKKKTVHISWRIFRKAIDNQLNLEEKRAFEAWLQANIQNATYFEKAVMFYKQQDKKQIVEEKDDRSAFEEFLLKTQNIRKRKTMNFIRVAASVIVILGFGILYHLNSEQKSDYLSLQNAAPIQPLANTQVELVLSGGEKVYLEKDGEVLIKDKNIEIIKKEGVVDYMTAQKANKGKEQYNTVSVPRGADFQLVLSEGTKVWLNSESSIRYPIQFAGKSRRVQITGEVSFDVSENTEQPFIVEVGKTKIKVLGTEFNINAYQNAIETTLIEGKVLVENGLDERLVIYPSEQAITRNTKGIEVQKSVDVSKVIDWRRGLFDFEDEKLGNVLNELARWYDLKIFFESEELKQLEFTGALSRKEDVNQLLQLFEMTKSVKFYIKDNVILVQKQ